MLFSMFSRLLLGVLSLGSLTCLMVWSCAWSANANPAPGLSQNVLSDFRRMRVNQTIVFPVLGNDIDSADAIAVTQQPATGTLTVKGKQLAFTPNNGVSGHSVAKIKVHWPDGNSDTANIELTTEQVGNETYFDPANGSDSNPGTVTKPKKTGIQSAINKASDGDRIYLRGGQTYDLGLSIRKIGGTVATPIVLGSFGGERANIQPSDGRAFVFDNSVGTFVIENIDITGKNGDRRATAVLATNEPGDTMNVIFDDVVITGAGRLAISWQDRGSGSVTLVRCNIHDNTGMGFLGGADDTKIMNSVFSRNHDAKDYNGGAMGWNIYTGKNSGSLQIEGNTIEDSEGLIKLRAAKNFTVQKNTLRRGWVIGLGGGGQVDKSLRDGRTIKKGEALQEAKARIEGKVPKDGTTLKNGLIAYNLIVNSGNPMSFGDSDGWTGGGIANVDVRNNVVIDGCYSAGFTRGSTLTIADHGDINGNFRIFDNIFWANQRDGFGGAHLAHDNVEFYNNIVGGGHATEGWQNYVLRLTDHAANVHNNTLYKFQKDTDLGIPLNNGNEETTTIPPEVADILNRLKSER